MRGRKEGGAAVLTGGKEDVMFGGEGKGGFIEVVWSSLCILVREWGE